MKILGLPPDIGNPAERLKEIGQKEPIGPCGQYRIKYPLEALNNLDDVSTEYGGYPLDYVWEYAREFDIIVLHRQTMPHFRAFVDHCQTFLGKKVVVDVDDAVLDLDPRNPAYVWWGKDKDLVWEMFCQLRDSGQSSERAKTFGPDDVYRVVAENRSGFDWMLRHADMVSVTTEFLKKEYESYNDNVIVLPNCVVAEDWIDVVPRRHPDADGKVVLGWSGGDTHVPDLEMVKNAIARILRKYTDVVFLIVGFPDAVGIFPEDVRDKILTVPWSGIDEYRGWLSGFDIGLAPAQRNKTNMAKSGIRIYEMALARSDGMPIVASPWPYGDDIHQGMGTVALNDQKFEKAISKYIRDEELRRVHGRALREHILDDHMMDHNVYKWFEAYSNLLN